MEIDLKHISKDELIKLWKKANKKKDISNLTPRQKLNAYLDWLEDNDFGCEIMNYLGKDISTNMCAIYVHGSNYDYWDENGKYSLKKYTVDQENPNIEDLYRFAVIDGLMKDDEYLKEFGITKKKNPTKKTPYLFNDIDWNVFSYSNFLNNN